MWHFRRLFCALLLNGGLAPATGIDAVAAASDDNARRNPHPRSASSRWTEEMYLEAQPRPMPTAAGRAGLLAPTAVLRPPEETVSQQERVVEGAAAEPALRLYQPIDAPGAGGPDDALIPQAVTDEGAAFSHSRVFPPAAVRQAPYYRTGKLFSLDETTGDSFECTGALIQRRLVLTAAHCLYTFEDGPPRFLDDFEFVPAFNRGVAPLGRWDWETAIVTQSFVDGDGAGSPPYQADFGILVLRDQFIRGRTQAIGDLVGWYGWQTVAALGNHMTILGFPGNLDDGERQQRTDAGAFAAAQPNSVELGSFQGPGSSGGPALQNFGKAAAGQPPGDFNQIVGVNSYRSGDLGDPLIIGISILNGEFLDINDQACDDQAGNCDP